MSWLFALALALAAPTSLPAPRWTVRLVPLGPFPSELIDAIDRGLRAELPVTVERGEPHALPPEAWYPRRKRYRADTILEVLEKESAGAPANVKVLGLTRADISTTKGAVPDWGIFGLGQMDGRAAVISDHRLRRKARDAAHLEFRVVTTAIHEIGHTLGLPHCPEAACVMRDAEGTIRTVDSGTGHFGPACRAQLGL